MSRQTPQTYLCYHYQLKTLWEQKQQAFSHLSPIDQLNLHKYFLLSLAKTDQELLDHRRNVKLGDPSLANRAGKAYAKLMRGEEAPVKNSATIPDSRRIYLRAVMRPEPNIELIAKALIMLAKHENKLHSGKIDSSDLI